MLNILFMGTPDFARDSLEEIYNAKYNIVGVVTNIDKPKGRGMKMTYSPVKEFAIEKKIRLFQPEKVKNNIEFIEEIKQLNPEVIVVVAYGKILPKEVLDIPKFGCINVHGSLLPKYRGAAPIQWAIINGEEATGVTTMFMNIGMDSGDIILKEEVKIGEDETTGQLWERLSKIGAKLAVKTLEYIESGNVKRIPQGEEYTLAPIIKKEFSKIDWEKMTSLQIKNLVRGLNPIMGTYTFLQNKKIKIWKVEIIELNNFEMLYEFENERKVNFNSAKSGTVLIANDKDGLYIKTSDGIIKLLEIQEESGKRMETQQFLRGSKVEIGTILQ